MLRIELLGPVRVVADGADATPKDARERTALAVMALAAPTPLSADRLADELYGDALPTDARNAIQAIVSRLRRGLGAHSHHLQTSSAGYVLTDTSPRRGQGPMSENSLPRRRRPPTGRNSS